MWQGRQTWAEIDLDAIEHNVRELKRLVPPTTKMMAVIKANAYGHGAVAVAAAARRGGAERFAVACVEEGIVLRQAGVTEPILLLGAVSPGEADAVARFGLTSALATRQLALALSAAGARHGVTVPVHVKVDTGMGRFGLLPSEVVPFVKGIVSLPRLDFEGLFTHFASADEADKTYTRQQLETYLGVVQALAAEGIEVRIRHAANSAATMEVPEAHLDMVRCGIAIYGLWPSDEVRRSIPLRPAMTIKSRVARVRRLPEGASISYGRTYVLPKPTAVALVPAGYADGVRRGLSNRGHVLIRGQRAPIRGRVCMDQFVVEVEHIPGVQQDDEVVLIGAQGEERITAEEVGALVGTINYEITCGIAPRVPRLYRSGGALVGVDSLLERAFPLSF